MKSNLALIYVEVEGLIKKTEMANKTGVLFDEREMKILEIRLNDIKKELEEFIYE